MNKKVKEPFFIGRIVNMVIGFMVLALILPVIHLDTGTEIYEVLIFALTTVQNFIAATINFSEQKKVRGNLFAILCSIFLLCTVILAVRYFVFV